MDLGAMKDDYDWQNAFHEAVFGEYGPGHDATDRGPIDRVVEIHHAVEGENDGDEWVAVGLWDDGQFFIMAAGCDYTGWHCRAGGVMSFYPTIGTALANLTPEQSSRFGLIHDADAR